MRLVIWVLDQCYFLWAGLRLMWDMWAIDRDLRRADQIAPHPEREAWRQRFAMGVAAVLIMGWFGSMAYRTGYAHAWHEAGRVVGCSEKFPVLTDIPDYVSADTGQLVRFTCAARE